MRSCWVLVKLNREGLAKAERSWHHGSMPKPKTKKHSKRNPPAPASPFRGRSGDRPSRPGFSGLLSGIVMKAAETTLVFLLLAPLIIAFWLSGAWSADITPLPPEPLESRPDHPQGPSTPPPSSIDPGIERRPQTIPHPRSAVTPPNVDPKMAIDPETAPPVTGKKKPGGSTKPPTNPPTR